MAHKILLVEDDLDIQGFAKTVLESEGFIVETCETASRAIALFSASPADLVVIDIGLPDGNGLDVCRRCGDIDSGVPFIFMTAKEGLPTRLEAFKSGAQDYIQKPFAVQELLARVRVHMKVKISHDDIAKRNHDLEALNRARQDLTDMIVHDLKTPLTSIKGTLELIKSRGLISSDAYATLVDHAGTAADFMLLMLNDLLDIGRSEQAGLSAAAAKFELAPIFEKLKSLFASRAQRSEVELKFSISDGAKVVFSDQNFLFRILANLIANAVKASTRGQSVEIGASRKGRDLRLTVADRGSGVAAEIKNNIFKKYATTGSGSFLEDGGSGIGLTFCRLAAQTLKGKIWLEDQAGGGSLFVVDLPDAVPPSGVI